MKKNQREFLARVLKTGLKIDYWWMDAGWYPFKSGWWNTGTWDVDPAPLSTRLCAHIGGSARARREDHRMV